MSIKTLIIEDNENNMYLISFLLQNNGHDVSQAYDGQDGVSLDRKSVV